MFYRYMTQSWILYPVLDLRETISILGELKNVNTEILNIINFLTIMCENFEFLQAI